MPSAAPHPPAGQPSPPWRGTALWGFGLNAVWEFAQCTLLYDMWDWGFWRATAYMWGAILGDGLIVLGIARLAQLLAGSRHVWPPDVHGWVTLLVVGFVASVGLEWIARAFDLWGYSDLMPMLVVAGHPVGLSPIVQVTLLPALSVYFASQRIRTATQLP